MKNFILPKYRKNDYILITVILVYNAFKIHFVNWNCTVYSTPQEASNSQKHDGLLVFGVFAQVNILTGV